MPNSLQPHGLQHPRIPLFITISWSLLKFKSIKSMMSSNHLIRCTKYWSFSFSIVPSNVYSGLISFRIDWFDLLAVQKTLESSPAPQFKSISSSALSLHYGPTLTSIHDYWKNHGFNYMDLCWQSDVSAF